jgi:ubiquinone/menaquinone biosynthesis C-methylase UbiE/uncharacterized protein YbaR (Trm112 family)
MQISFLEYLSCPMGCQSGLDSNSTHDDGNNIQAGSLTCSTCARRWPIEDGIPRLLPDLLTAETESSGDGVTARSDETAARQRKEMQARDEQAEEYDQMWHLNLFGAVEIPLTLRNMDLARNHLLLEAGCGTGRMTSRFATKCREQVSVDFSWESLRACSRKLNAGGIKNVHLAQADLCHLPFRSEAFDRVVSCQVLEHIPSAAARELAVAELARVLMTGGNLTLSAYQYSLLMRAFGEKEGEHDGGIYFYRFTRKELRELLASFIRVEAITGTLVYHYIARCRK